MYIQIKEDKNKGQFFIEEAGEELAEMIFTKAEKMIIIDHTEVNEKLEGKGVGKQLVQFAAEYARNHQIKIIPLCPFAKKVLEAGKEYEDVLE